MFWDRGSSRRSATGLRRAVLLLVATSLVALAVVGTAAVVVARALAEHTALLDAEESARALGKNDVAALVPRAEVGDPAAMRELAAMVATRRADSGLLRIKVWRRDGRVLYSDQPAAIGQYFPLDEAVEVAIDKNSSSSDLSLLTDPENASEEDLRGRRVVEVYVPLELPNGTRVAFETYSTDAPLTRAENALVGTMVPFALGALLLLMMLQLPTSIWILRRMARARDDRSRLLRGLIAASDRERRSIAQDLHDGMAQNLAAAGYLLDAVRSDMPGAGVATRETVDRISLALGDAAMSLRTSLVDIYPDHLTAEGLPGALEDLAVNLQDDGIEVSVTGQLPSAVSQETTVWLYRLGRECLANIHKHASASSVSLILADDGRNVSLTAIDDGVGGAGVRQDGDPGSGHMGLRFLHDSVVDLGGSMDVRSVEGEGTVVRAVLPRNL